MPSRKFIRPGGALRDTKPNLVTQDRFIDVFEDEPLTEIPNGAIAKAINEHVYGIKTGSRNGSKLFTQTRFPAIVGRTGYNAHKEVGTLNGVLRGIIVSDSGNIFSRNDINNVWVWDNYLSDRIIAYISPTRVYCRDTDPNNGNDCYVQGSLNGWIFHQTRNIWIFQIGEDFYTADMYITEYTKVELCSVQKPSNYVSRIIVDSDDVVIFQNSRGMFKIYLDTDPVEAYRCNSPVPSKTLVSNAEEGDKSNKYFYIVAMAKITNQGHFIHREYDLGKTLILTESGTTVYDSNRQDWTEINTETPIGLGADRYGVLESSPAGFPTNPAAAPWNLTNATFSINVNGLGYWNIVCDFTGVVDMRDVAAIIQEALRLRFPSATCQYIADAIGPRLRITSGKVAGGNVSYALPGVGGTDISAAANLTLAAGAIVSQPLLNISKTIYGLRVPMIDNYINLTTPEWFWTHYVVYRTGNLGAFMALTADQKKELLTAVHIEGGTTVINSRDQFIWNKDLRISGAFIARRWNGYVELRADAYGGEFEKADEGSVVEFEDGSRVQLSEGGYVNNKLCRYAGGGDYYYGDNTPWMAACIGDGRCARVNQAGDVITIYPGSDTASILGGFTATDERKPICYSNGYRTFIKRVINNTSIQVYTSFTVAITEFAITIDPHARAYTDIVNDDTLYSRAIAWTCKNRFFKHFKPANLISIQPGFILVAKEGSMEVRYCQIGPSYKQFTGYHDREIQKIDTQDPVMELVSFKDKYSVMCAKSVSTGSTNSTASTIIPGTEQEIRKLFGLQEVAKFGIPNKSAVRRVNDDPVRVVTSTGEIRDFDGISFGPNLIRNQDGLSRMSRAVDKSYKYFCMIYSRLTGFVIWWKKK